MRIHDGRTEKQLSVHILLNNYEAEEGEGKREEGGREMIEIEVIQIEMS